MTPASAPAPAGPPRPKLSWADLAGARVGLWGLGREGRASLRKLRTMNTEPVLVDDHPPAGTGTVLATQDGGLAALQRCDVVIKTPFCAPCPNKAPMNSCTVGPPTVLPGL